MYSVILIIFLSVPLALSQELFEKKMVCRNRHCLENRVDFLEKEYEFMINSHVNLNNALSDKDPKLTDYQERLSEKEKIIQELETELNALLDKGAKLKDYQERLSEKEKIIQELETELNALSDKDAKLKDYQERLSEKEKIIQELETELKECTERNKDLNNTLLEIKNQTQDSEGNIRFAGGVTISGRVEILHDGRWGTICDDGWDKNDARVVCRMLGYSGGIALKQGSHGQGSGEIWLDNVNCMGNESFIGDCSHNGWGKHNCAHSEDASVACT